MAEVDSWYDQNGNMTRAYHARLAKAGKGYSNESGSQFGLSQSGDYNGISFAFDSNTLNYGGGNNWGTTSNSGGLSDSGWSQNPRVTSRPSMSSRGSGYRRRR